MNYRQYNKLNMYLAVEHACRLQAADWQGIPAAVRAFTDFQSCIQQIQDCSRQQGRPITGATQDKELSRKQLVQKAHVIAQATRSYALSVADLRLVEALKAPLSEWMYYRKHLVQAKTAQLLATVIPLADALTDYGIRTADLSELQTLFAAFNDRMESARTSIVQRLVATENIQALFQQGDRLIQMLDRLFLQLQETGFYMKYQGARRTVRLRPRGAGKRGKEEVV